MRLFPLLFRNRAVINPRPVLKRKLILSSLSLFLLAPSLMAASLADLQFPFTFKVKSAVSTLKSAEDASRPGFLLFHVESPHGPYDVETLAELRKTLHEIEVIEQVRKGLAGSGFTEGAVDSVVATGEGVKNLVTNPIESGKNIGAAAGKLGRRVGGVFRSKEEGEKTSFSEKVFGGSQREIAVELGVDVYTRNPKLQKILADMAQSRMGGKGVAAVGKFLLPIAGLVSAAVTAGGVNSAADQFVNTKSKGDLFSANQKALEEMGFSARDIRIFLNKSFYTPREVTYIRFYLERLKGAAGYQEIFRRAVQCMNPWEAREILYAAEMAAETASSKKGLLRIYSTEAGIALEDGTNFIFLAPYDFLDAGEAGKKVLSLAEALKALKPFAHAEILVAGQPAPGFIQEAARLKMDVKGWMLFRTIKTDPAAV